MAPLGWPNLVTLFRLLLTLPFTLLLLDYGLDPQRWKRWTALAVFALMALTDLLDGYLARRLHQFTPLGRVLDPLADKLLILSALPILMFVGVVNEAAPAAGPPHYLPAWLVVAAITKEIVVTAGLIVVYARTRRFHVCPRSAGKACTAAQMTALFALLLLPDLPDAAAGLLDLLFVLAAALSVLAMLDYVVAGRRFLTDQQAHPAHTRGNP